MTSPSPARPARRPFQDQREPEPFYRTPEFQRFLLLGLGLVVVALLYVFVSARTKQREAAEAAQAEREAALPPLPGPEEIEARKLKLKTAFEGALTDTENSEDFRETSGYRHLLQILSSYPAEEISRLAVRKLDWKAAMADPDGWRGEFVSTRGVVANAYAVKLREPVAGRSDVYQGILTDPNGDEGVFFDTPDPLSPLELRKDAVDVEGIFYRTVRYTNYEKGETREAPYLLVKTVHRVEAARRNPSAMLRNRAGVALVGIALAIGAVHLLVYWFQRRSKRRAASLRAERAGFREMFEKKLKERSQPSGPRSQA